MGYAPLVLMVYPDTQKGWMDSAVFQYLRCDKEHDLVAGKPCRGAQSEMAPGSGSALLNLPPELICSILAKVSVSDKVQLCCLAPEPQSTGLR